MILYTCPGEECGVGGNDDIDRLAGNLGSRVGVLTNYTGWLYALVGPGPNLEPEYALSPLYTYTMMCTQSAPPTPSPTPTRPATGGGGAGDKGGGTFPTPTLAATPTLAPGEVAVTPSPTPRPVVVIQPLPTATPAGPPVQQINLEITVYYDLNNNFTPESTEGVMDVAVAVYDNASGQLLSLGFTNGDGRVLVPDHHGACPSGRSLSELQPDRRRRERGYPAPHRAATLTGYDSLSKQPQGRRNQEIS